MFILINFDIRTDKDDIPEEYEKLAESLARVLFKEEGVKLDYYIEIIICDEEFIREANNKYRKIDKVTDVLSFPLLNYEKGKTFKDTYIGYEFEREYLIDDLLYLGDILICKDKVKRQSEEFGVSLIREFCYLTVHSFLHLLGYDHILDLDKKIMRGREEDLLRDFFEV